MNDTTERIELHTKLSFIGPQQTKQADHFWNVMLRVSKDKLKSNLSETEVYYT